MTWENVVAGALEGISRFVYDFINIVFGSLNADTIEGLLGLGFLSIILRTLNGGGNVAKKDMRKIMTIVDEISTRVRRETD